MRWPVPDCHLGEPATVDIEDHGCSGTAAGWLNQGSANRPAILSFVAATARPGTQLTDPTVRLSAAAHPYLRPPSFAPETEAGALPKAEFGWIGSNPDGRAEPPQTAIDTFTGEITAVDLLPGKRYYRAVGDGQYPNGAFWTEEPIGSEVALRRDYAVRNDWNGNRGLVILVPNRTVPSWVGQTAPQQATGDSTRWLPGGARQLWVEPGTLGAKDGDWFILPMPGAA
jgi:hypothetical protein